MIERVVVTGAGVVSSAGVGVEEFWNGLHQVPEAGLQRVELTDELKSWADSIKASQRMDRFTHFAGHAAMQAIKQSGILDSDNSNTGVILGVGLAGLDTQMREHDVLNQAGESKVSPFLVPEMIANRPGAAISIRFGLQGQSQAIATACASSADAIGGALRSIRHGYLDAAVVGGTEAALHELGVAGFKQARALSRLGISRPFSPIRDGFVMSEGAGILVLESFERAQRRGAVILAEVLGYGANSNAEDMVKPSKGGLKEIEAIERALADAGLETSDIRQINAHGTSTPLNDLTEAGVIYSVFGDKTPVTSTKGATGHALGAAAGLEAIATILSMQKEAIPHTVCTEERDPKIAPIDVVLDKDRNWRPGPVVSNSFGFGGHNGVLVIAPAPN